MREGPGVVPQRVIGRYALYGEIASGGMATVHFGRLLGPVGFSRTVAIKRLHPQFAKDPEFVSMFLDEARVAARIQHPNVVATLDVVALQGELFLVMEYVQGESLARIMRNLRARHDRVPPKMVGSIATNLLYGLHAAHEAKSERGEPLGIVHRDVSPQNVLVGIDGVSRVLDFGVAKAAGRVQVTREGQVKGKLAYMPPEQLAGGSIDRRADIYAASVLIWEAITGKRLFDGDNQSVILAQVLTAEVDPPSKFVPGLSPEVDGILMKGLSRNPNGRFSTAHEMAMALEDTLGIESPRRIGEFVEAHASDSLSAKAARVKEIESLDTDSAVQMMRQHFGDATIAGAYPKFELPLANEDRTQALVPAAIPGDGSGLSRVSSVSLSLPGEQRRPGRVLIAVLGTLAGLAVGAALWLGTRTGDTHGTTASSGIAPTALPAPSVPSVAPDPPADARPPVEPPPAASASASASARASAAPVAAIPRPPRPRTAAPAPPKSPSGGQGCDPPFTIDATGKRKLKPWCL